MTRARFMLCCLGMAWIPYAAEAAETPTILLVHGAAGEPHYGSNYLHQVECWQQTGQQAGAQIITIGVDPTGRHSDREKLREALEIVPRDARAALWLVLIGHGSFDGKHARFNLRGPDISATELKSWLDPFQREVIVINTTSASAPFLHQLSAPKRIVITATRSSNELNYTRFGQFLAAALTDPRSDYDQDGQTSLLEAFLAAAAQVRDFYVTESRLATEHALIDDNGDGKGTPADWFRGVRARKKPNQDAGVDGSRAHQIHLVPSLAERALPPEVRAQRDALEQDIFSLRDRKADLDEETYLRKLESLLLQLAQLYQASPPPP